MQVQWSRLINLALMISTYFLWDKNQDTIKKVENLRLQIDLPSEPKQCFFPEIQNRLAATFQLPQICATTINPCAVEAISDEQTLNFCIKSTGNTSAFKEQRYNMLLNYHNNIGINKLSPTSQQEHAIHIGETNSAHLICALTDHEAIAIARNQVCKPFMAP